jgi:hypothetical protein
LNYVILKPDFIILVSIAVHFVVLVEVRHHLYLSSMTFATPFKQLVSAYGGQAQASKVSLQGGTSQGLTSIQDEQNRLNPIRDKARQICGESRIRRIRQQGSPSMLKMPIL